jgi:hypothetical protein
MKPTLPNGTRGHGRGATRPSLLTEFFPFSSTPLLLPTPTVQHTDSLLPICLDHTSQDRRKSRGWLREVFF